MSEVKVVFVEGGRERALRGVLDGEDEFFVTIKRRDGIFRIAKNRVVKIEELCVVCGERNERK